MDSMAMNDELRTGVYAIRHATSGKVYVGSAATSFKQRWSQHRCGLRKGKHGNRHLQAAWSKYGEAAFEFVILAVTEPGEAVVCEQRYIDEYLAAECGYNICPIAVSSRGVRRSESFRRKISERLKVSNGTPEYRAAQSQRMRIANGTPEAREAQSERMKIINGTPEYRKAMSGIQKAIYSNPDVIKKHAEICTSSWTDRRRKAISDIMKTVKGTPEARKAISDSNKITHTTPEFRKESSERARLQFSTQESREAMSAKLQEFYSDPVRKAERLRKVTATMLQNKLRKASSLLVILLP